MLCATSPACFVGRRSPFNTVPQIVSYERVLVHLIFANFEVTYGNNPYLSSMFNGVIIYFFFLWQLDPSPGHDLPVRGFAIVLRGRTTLGRTPLDEWSALSRGLYLTTQNPQNRNAHATGGIRTRNPSRQAAADPRLRPRGDWDRRVIIITSNN
jgi:hypothetical protein